MPTTPAPVAPYKPAKSEKDSKRTTGTKGRNDPHKFENRLSVRFKAALTDNGDTPPSSSSSLKLSASEKRRYEKLSHCRDVIEAQTPTAIQDTIIKLGTDMITANVLVNQAKSCLRPFENADTSDPYIPRNARIDFDLEIPENLNDDADVKKLMEEAAQKVKDFQEKAADLIKQVIQLRIKRGSDARLQTFAKGFVALWEDYVVHRVVNLGRCKTEHSYRELATIFAHRYAETKTTKDEILPYLECEPSQIHDAIGNSLTRDEARKSELLETATTSLKRSHSPHRNTTISVESQYGSNPKDAFDPTDVIPLPYEQEFTQCKVETQNVQHRGLNESELETYQQLEKVVDSFLVRVTKDTQERIVQKEQQAVYNARLLALQKSRKTMHARATEPHKKRKATGTQNGKSWKKTKGHKPNKNPPARKDTKNRNSNHGEKRRGGRKGNGNRRN